ncbi:MAG TPA: translation elongation factor 4, partial [Spirochaetia bacterium]|nr:translation elongation factor 4 [Spirochaetia bacterium]
MPHPTSRIRNFCIIAHIDHGKSTLADRFIQRAKIIDDRNFQNQLLDNMDIERERGITIKSQAVCLPYTAKDGQVYSLNLVDTPGHADFSYEVSRAIASCEGALLVIDATQGVQAQTLSNLYMAMDHDLEIIPVINKIDMPGADIQRIKDQIDHDLGLDSDVAIPVSAKVGLGMDELLEAIVAHIPPPKGEDAKPLQSIIFDSHFDPFRGVIIHVRNFEGTLKEGDQIRLYNTGGVYTVEEVGYFRIVLNRTKILGPGEVGYIIAGIKNISDVRVGDTVTLDGTPCEKSLPGFKDVKPVVFSSLYPIDSNDYEELAKALEKLKLNDAALIYEKDSSVALGFGFKCGFLGLLHLEVVQERLEREFDLSIILTSPSVQYKIFPKRGSEYFIETPAAFPDPTTIEKAEEPYIHATIITPSDYLGNLMTLCTQKRGVQTNMTYLDPTRVELRYDMPLAEVLFDFYDKLKSISKGYASFDYDMAGFQETDLVKLDILINGESVDALSMLVFKGNAYDRGRKVCDRLKDEIDRQQFKIAIQAAIGNTVIARETVNAYRKDVLAKCYGGDITRKRKLL